MDMYSARPSPVLAWPGLGRLGLAWHTGPARPRVCVCVCVGGGPPSNFFNFSKQLKKLKKLNKMKKLNNL